MSRDINFKKWFVAEKESIPLTMGIELELLLFDYRNKEPLQNMNLCEKILDNLRRNKKTQNIYRDYYSYQLEIRTNPHDNPDDLLRETRELYKEASEEFLKHSIFIIPVPAIVRNGYMYCGLHTHINYTKEKKLDNYYYKSMGMYPFILSLADHTKNFEISEFKTSDRLEKSNHINTPYLDKKNFLSGNRGDGHKYRDVILSLPISQSDTRSRLVKPITTEVRITDTPSLYSFYEFIIRYLFHLSSRIRIDNPMIDMLKKDYGDTSNKLNLTRNLLINQRYGVNKIFKMLNSDVCEDVAKFFGIDFPSQTQFEYREDNGLSADVNGFLNMATKGGWL